MSGGFFRGTSAEQDTRFSNKQAKLMKSQKFAPELEILVDITKVKMDVIKPWIAKRVTELLTFEDEVVINFIYGLLEGKDINGKSVQISLTGFMEKHTGKFMKELWSLLISAQNNTSGVPQQFLDAKEEETRKKEEELERIRNEIQKKREKGSRESDHGKSTMDGGVIDDSSRGPISDHGLKDSKAYADNEKEPGARNGFRGRSRISRSPQLSGRTRRLSPIRDASRSPSKSHSHSRSYSEDRNRSRKMSRSPPSRRRSISSQRKDRSPKISVSPTRQLPSDESLSPRRRISPKRRSTSRSRRSPFPARHRVRSPVHRRSPSPGTRRSPSPSLRRSRSPRRRRTPSWRCRSPALRRRRTPSPWRHRSRSPRRRRSPSPRRRRSPSPIRRQRRRSPSSSSSPVGRRPPPSRRRSPSPFRRRSPSPFRRRSPSPFRRRSPSPFRRRSPSPSRRRSPSPSKRRSLSPSKRRSPPLKRRSPSPSKRRSPPSRRRSPSPPSRRSPPARRRSPTRRRSPSPLKRRSPSLLKRRSPSPLGRRSPSPLKRRSPSPLKHRSPSPSAARSLSPVSGSLSPVKRKVPVSAQRLPDQLDGSSSQHSRSSSPPVRHISLSPSERELRTLKKASSQSPRDRLRIRNQTIPTNNHARKEKTAAHDDVYNGQASARCVRSKSPPSKDQTFIEDRKDKECKSKSSQRHVHSPGIKNLGTPDKPSSQHYHDDIYLRKKEGESKIVTEKITTKEAGHSGVDISASLKRPTVLPSLDHLKESEVALNLIKKDDLNRPAIDSSVSEGSDNHKVSLTKKRKHRKSSRRDVESETSGDDSEVEDKKEAKKRRKEDKKLRKEERRRRREERRRRKEGKRAHKRRRKSKDSDTSSSDSEKNENNVNASMRDRLKQTHLPHKEESQKRLENELREKAIQNLKAKKGVNH